ncbi:MAG: hypothetical protein J0M35_13605 [Candidatus Obscuribacter phosphatis]|uniref:Uncharacterized protein n=1 Tax=Candidatus Obscuribacter phosphatis TaxID=1906157 RepID=A0A8J7P9B4_9BACT|nr:hypothetical protein [Candidatus Obscuribacter phosphatis]
MTQYPEDQYSASEEPQENMEQSRFESGQVDYQQNHDAMSARTDSPYQTAVEQGQSSQPAPQPTLESGKVWENRTTKEILYGISKNKKSDYAVLRLASHDINIDGELLISKGSTVNGARLLLEEGSVEGYPALKALLKITDGTYSLLDYAASQASAMHLEQGLKVRINNLLTSLPDLPDTLEELNEGAAVGKIRGFNPTDLPVAEEESSKAKNLRGKGEPPPHLETAEEALQRTMPVAVIITVVVIVLAIIATIVVISFKPTIHQP